MAHEDIIGKHAHLFAKPENYTPPTKDPKDCICGAKADTKSGRLLIANCPCCDGVQILVVGVCDCPSPSFVKLKAVIANKNWIRRIESSEEL
jgi:hypothetical protein